MTTAYELFAQAQVVLLDFDGPVCSVFAENPPEFASAAAVRALAERGVEVPAEWASRADPHVLLRDLNRLVSISDEGLQAADEEICRYEIEAVRGASPTDGLRESLDRLGLRRWGIVSNNCKSAVERYLHREPLLRPQPEVVLGRRLGHPESLKPAPTLLHEALHQLGAQPSEAVFVGDSTSDVRAGLVAGVPVIGYANKPGKAERLARAGASAIVSRLTEMLS